MAEPTSPSARLTARIFSRVTAQAIGSAAAGTVNLSALTSSLGADVTMNVAGTYFDGPSVAQGVTGTWFASGTVTIFDPTTASATNCKLWDGTTIMASVSIDMRAVNTPLPGPLSGFIASPAGNIRISCSRTSGTTGLIKFNQSGNSKDSTISVFRIQ